LSNKDPFFSLYAIFDEMSIFLWKFVKKIFRGEKEKSDKSLNLMMDSLAKEEEMCYNYTG